MNSNTKKRLVYYLLGNKTVLIDKYYIKYLWSYSMISNFISHICKTKWKMIVSNLIIFMSYNSFFFKEKAKKTF